MHPSFALVQKKLQDLQTEFETFKRAHDEVIVPLQANASEISTWAAVAMMGSGIEGCYTGIEGILKELVVRYDGAIDQHSFHKKLLAQASLATNDRPAILSDRTYSLADELRAFRHVERNVYRHAMRAPDVVRNYQTLLELMPVFESEVSTFVSTESAKLEIAEAERSDVPAFQVDTEREDDEEYLPVPRF